MRTGGSTRVVPLAPRPIVQGLLAQAPARHLSNSLLDDSAPDQPPANSGLAAIRFRVGRL